MSTASPAELWPGRRPGGRPAATPSYLNGRWKRLADLLGAAALLLVASPLMVAISLIILWDSGWPVLYRQQRVGRNRRRQGGPPAARRPDIAPDRRHRRGEGKPFQIIKFRTMVRDAEHTGPIWSPYGDERVTRPGRWLRASHLDELPQLWNVLRGEMSLVGPRPERPHFVHPLANLLPGYRHRFLVRPGITGLAQLENGYDTSFDDVRRKLALEIRYLRSATPSLDIRLLLRTVPHLWGADPGDSAATDHRST